MTTAIDETPIAAPSRYFAAEVRAWSARRGLTGVELARRVGKSQVWISRRIGVNATVEVTLEDVQAIAGALGVDASVLLPRLDSNQQPFDYPRLALAA